jgi:hypothetical protein
MPQLSANAAAKIGRIAVVSDTHGDVTSSRAAVRLLESLDVECVLHCGDIGTPAIVELFAPWPTHFVFGNTDYDPKPLRAAIQDDQQTCDEAFGDLRIGGCRIALLHGDDGRRLDMTIASGDWNLVCHGHTHRMLEERVGPTLVLNPGALHRAKPHSFALVELPKLSVTMITL